MCIRDRPTTLLSLRKVSCASGFIGSKWYSTESFKPRSRTFTVPLLRNVIASSHFISYIRKMEFPSFSSFMVYFQIHDSLFPEGFFSQRFSRKAERTLFPDKSDDPSDLVMTATFLVTSAFFVKASPNPSDIRIGKRIPQKSTPGSLTISLKRDIISSQSCFSPENLFINFPSC